MEVFLISASFLRRPSDLISILKSNNLDNFNSKLTCAPFINKDIEDSIIKNEAACVINSTGPGELKDALNFKSSLLMVSPVISVKISANSK